MTEDGEELVRCTAVFAGTVQGVGFRATTRRVAGAFAVAGWVRNEPDGTVRCVAEGAREEVDRFLAAVRAAMSPLVRDMRVDRSPATGAFTGFEVRHEQPR
ncbi:MAG: acylphosphatase [Phycisphaerales bacterium]|nr:acylphosphatase [Phycisphaerales bacterium]